jgi:hypothetical protein
MPHWLKVDGAELEERLALSDGLADLVPQGPAIYMWRRNLRPPPAAHISPSSFRSWVSTILAVPLASLRRRELSHYALLESLVIGGQALSNEKQETLELLARNNKGRSYVVAFLGSIASALPAIYVGEAENLEVRVRSHLRGESGLRESIAKELGMSWNDLELWYYCLPPGGDETTAKSLRTLLETIATKLTLAPCVRRIG